MPIEQAAGADRKGVTHLEAFGRLMAGLAPWLELSGLDGEEARLQARTRTLATNALEVAVDPASPDAMNFTRESQPLVDAAFLAQAILRAPTALRDTMSSATKRRLVAALESTRAITPGFNNWLLFSATVEAALKALGASLGPPARRLRAAPARAVVQGRRPVRRRPAVPLGLLQQLRDPADAAGRARDMRRRLARMDARCARASWSERGATPPSSSA